MISKNDCYILLAELEKKGIQTQEILGKLVQQVNPSIEIIKFINDNRQLELTNFYSNLRKNYNKKHSNLYLNIVKEIEDPKDVLTTLSAMLTQILLYSNKVDDKDMFLRHARASDICKVLTIYFTNHDLTNCINLLRIIKADIKALESIKD